MKSGKGSTPGQIYRCSICGAELSVIRGGSGVLKPVCCAKEMMPLAVKNIIFVCPVCRGELMAIRGNAGNMAPVCCNRKMKVKR